MPTITIDSILSDPLLLTATALLVLGPIVFLVSLVKFVRLGRQAHPVNLDDGVDPMAVAGDEGVESAPAPVNVPSYMQEEVIVPPTPQPPQRTAAADKTVVMAPGSGEIQGQIEIAFTQIKTLNKKVQQLESDIETISRTTTAKLESHELKEPPINPADFMQKLLKLAEHVIVLEKEVARLKAEARTQAAAVKSEPDTSGPAVLEPATEPSDGPRPPIMPI